jgi:hypothetical protein
VDAEGYSTEEVEQSDTVNEQDSQDSYDTIEPDSIEEAEKYKEFLRNTLHKLTSNLNELDARIEEGEEGMASKRRQIVRDINSVREAQKEFRAITNSKRVTYRMNPLDKPAKSDVHEGGVYGWISYDVEDKVVVINYQVKDRTTQGHEMKHGYQFLRGKLSIEPGGRAGGLLYDLVDEKEAYRRQFSLSAGLGLSTFKKYSNINLENIAELGYNIPDVQLSTSTTIGEWEEATGKVLWNDRKFVMNNLEVSMNEWIKYANTKFKETDEKLIYEIIR